MGNISEGNFPLRTLFPCILKIFLKFLFIYDSHTKREREAETQAEGEAGSMHREPDVGFDPCLQDRALGQRQAPNRSAPPGSKVFLASHVPRDSVPHQCLTGTW